MRLVSVYKVKEACNILYRLLESRPPNVNISHREMPTPAKHRRFFNSCPYPYWCLIEDDRGEWIGSIYLTDKSELGIFFFPEVGHAMYGPPAIKSFMERYPREKFVANINPANAAYAEMYRDLGFTLIQHTYEKMT